MEIYVESLKHLIEKKVNLSEICVKVGMCYSNGDNSLFVEIKGILISFTLTIYCL